MDEYDHLGELEIYELQINELAELNTQMLALLKEIMAHDFNPCADLNNQSMRYNKIAALMAKATGEVK